MLNDNWSTCTLNPCFFYRNIQWTLFCPKMDTIPTPQGFPQAQQQPICPSPHTVPLEVGGGIGALQSLWKFPTHGYYVHHGTELCPVLFKSLG